MRTTSARGLRILACTAALVAAARDPALAQDEPRAGVIVEGANIWSARNDVRIPSATGTEFSITDLIGSGPDDAVRLEATLQLAERHGLRFVYAPIRIGGTGVPAGPILFAGESFTTQPTEAAYQFDNYRLTYRYRVYDGDTWRWKIGFTGFVRDARIALAQPGAGAEDTDVGFVPLGHVSGEARLSARWGLRLEVDGSAAPQGRAFDVLAALEYRPSPRWTLSAGYRTIEGGADVEEVFAFAWLNVAVVRVGVNF